MGLTVSCFLGLGVKVSVEVKMENCSIIHKQTICNLIMFIFIAFFLHVEQIPVPVAVYSSNLALLVLLSNYGTFSI